MPNARLSMATALAVALLGACCRPCAVPTAPARATAARPPASPGAVAAPGRTSSWVKPRKAMSSLPLAGRSKAKPRIAVMSGPQPRGAPKESPGGGHFEVLHVEFENQGARERGLAASVPPFAAVGPFASVFVPSEGVARFVQDALAAPGFRWLDADEPCLLQLPAGVAVRGEAPRGEEPESVVQGGRAGRRGTGVLIAVLSTGIDARHPDFVDVIDGKPRSRLAWYWDTLRPPSDLPGSRPAPLAYPDGAPVGALLDNAALTALLGEEAPELDASGDGTALAGIAAGNGRAAEGVYAGAAPEATLIAVRMGSGLGGRIENAALTGAVCRWLVEVAAGRPLVVVVGFGGTRGGRDGQLISERMLDLAFPPGASGVALVVAAGDGAGAGAHATLALGGNRTEARLPFHTRPGSSLVKTLTVWIADTPPDEEWAVETGDTLRILEGDVYFDERSAQTVIRVTTDGRAGYVSVRSGSGRAYTGDAWIEGGIFEGDAVNESALVEAPGTATGALAVGSSDWNDVVPAKGGFARLTEGEASMAQGDLSPFSAPGLRRVDGRVKPDLVAPGRWFLAPKARSETTATGDSTRFVSPDGHYVAVGGTAAAAAYTGGILALLLEAQPNATWGQIRARLEGALSRDRFTGPVPNARWGHGRLDLAAVDRFLAVPP